MDYWAPYRSGERIVGTAAKSVVTHPAGTGLQFLPTDFGDGSPLSDIRSASLKVVGTLPFITDKDELWRQTKPSLFPFDLFKDPGAFSFSADAKGLEILSNKEAASFVSMAEKLLVERSESLRENPAAQLQIAAHNSFHVIRVPKGVAIEGSVSLMEELQGSGAVAPIILVLVEKGASLSLFEDLEGDFHGLFAPRIEFHVDENASLKFSSLQKLPSDAAYLARHRFHIERDGRVSILYGAFGAKVARLDLDVRHYGPNGDADIRALSVVRDSQHVDLHTVQDHLAPQCHSNLLYKSVLKDKGRGVYYGYIKVAENAQRTDAYQKNRNLLLSEHARADAIPNLEIKANDVKCSHGASIGQVSDDELFYLMTRGLTKKKAERLLVEGFLSEVTLGFSDQKAALKIEGEALSAL